MKIVHPDYNEPKSLDELLCYKEDGVFDLIPKEEKQKLNTFLRHFEDFRELKNERIKNPNLYDNLPYSIDNQSWKSKQQDLDIIKKATKNRTQLKILDFGAWNGWLSNQLSSQNHHVIATDIFIDEYDGLKAIKFYKNDFTALHLLPNNIWRIQQKFDLIIFNRNLAYLENKEQILKEVKKMLNKDGMIILTGLAVYTYTEKIISSFKKTENEFINLYKSPFLIFKSKGYLDNNDLKKLKENSFKIYKYSSFKYIIKRIISRKSFNTFYAVYKNQAT